MYPHTMSSIIEIKKKIDLYILKITENKIKNQIIIKSMHAIKIEGNSVIFIKLVFLFLNMLSCYGNVLSYLHLKPAQMP